MAVDGRSQVVPHRCILAGLGAVRRKRGISGGLPRSLRPRLRSDAPAAFEIGLASAGAVNAITALALTAGYLFAERAFKSGAGRRHWTHSLLAGALTTLLVALLFGQTAADSALLGPVVLPVAYALVWFRKPGKWHGGSE